NDWVGDGRIMRMPLTDGAPETFAAGQLSPGVSIVIDGGNVYWTTLGAPDARDGKVMKCPTAGGTPEVLASGQASPIAMAVDATSVYWTTFVGGTIMKLTPK